MMQSLRKLPGNEKFFARSGKAKILTAGIHPRVLRIKIFA